MELSRVTAGEQIVVRGQVQGVGFRPTVWRLAQDLGLVGDVGNTLDGVCINLWGAQIADFVDRLEREAPPLARIESIERFPLHQPAPTGFSITETQQRMGVMQVAITPDAATCSACLKEVQDPFERLYRYPFANCTNCGPRFSLIKSAPYDRTATSMAAFDLCDLCQGAYENPMDRRYHAEPVACHACGPRVWIEKLGRGVVNSEAFSMLDDVDAVGGMLLSGHIVAIKGLGGFHLACDATQAKTVERLRRLKRRPAKPFALMARDVGMITPFAHVSAAEAELLQSAAAPIVLLQARSDTPLPTAVAPGLCQVGVMLPATPMHHLIFRRIKRPIIMTSGNISGQPQCFRNQDAREKLAPAADFVCLHDRDIVNPIDDSVARIDQGRLRLLRRARGYTPAAIAMPPGLEGAPDLRAYGADLKNTFCLTKSGQAILSQHMGDMHDVATQDSLNHNLKLYTQLYDHRPEGIVVDQHRNYASSKMGAQAADDLGLSLIKVQHHHAHVAACMADNAWPADGSLVLGVALDGAGWGEDGSVWGGEFLACTYAASTRLGTFKPVPLLGGDAAARQPWRSAYAHIVAQMGWAEFAMNFRDLDLYTYLQAKPRAALDSLVASDQGVPMATSCGRLFDAAAAMVGLAGEEQAYEGQAAMVLEAAIDPAAMNEPEDLAYPFTIPLLGGRGLPYIEPLGAWRALLGDLVLGTPVGTIAARFHRGLAKSIAAMVVRLCGGKDFGAVALSGGCFQNQTLFNLVTKDLDLLGLPILTHGLVPANDGGLALGQACIGAASLLENKCSSV